MKKIIVLNTLGKYIPDTRDMTSLELKELKINDLIYTFNAVRNYLNDFSKESIEYRNSFNDYVTLIEELVNRKIVEVLTNDSYTIDTETF